MDVNVILKYRRESDCWLCPGCETENDTSLGKCVVCGDSRTPTAPIVKAWSPADEVHTEPAPRPYGHSTNPYGTASPSGRPYTTGPYTTGSSGSPYSTGPYTTGPYSTGSSGRSYSSGPYSTGSYGTGGGVPPVKSGNGAAFVVIILIIVVFVVIIAAAVANAAPAPSDVISEAAFQGICLETNDIASKSNLLYGGMCNAVDYLNNLNIHI